MIATRRRPFRLPIKMIIKTTVFFGLVYVLVRVPFTHKLIFEGPLKPMWTQAAVFEKKFIAPSLDPVIEPLTALNLTRKLETRNKEIIALKKQLRGEEYQAKLSRRQIQALQKKSVAKSGPAVAAPAAAAAVAATGTAGATPMVQVTPSPDEAQTAAYWGSMEAENASAIAQKLDPSETARIFLAMKPDQVAEIMNALPADYNVKLQEVHLSYPKPVGM